MKCQICKREQYQVGDGMDYYHGMVFYKPDFKLFKYNGSVYNRIAMGYRLCHECQLSMSEQCFDLYFELNKILSSTKGQGILTNYSRKMN
jgi:hypothetical protein